MVAAKISVDGHTPPPPDVAPIRPGPVGVRADAGSGKRGVGDTHWAVASPPSGDDGSLPKSWDGLGGSAAFALRFVFFFGR